MLTILLSIGLSALNPSPGDEPARGDAIFAPENLVAWCIVPFDAKHRGPEERAAMMERLGIRRFAYDWRAEHLPQLDQELAALKRHGIELTAVWFPTTLDADARFILETLGKHDLHPQLWVMGGGEPTTSPEEQQARVKAEADRIRPIAEAAAKIGADVALYNHGGWFGDPDNQLAVIDELKMPNVGIVYNLHHGHDQLDRLPELLAKMKPHLLAVNLNGMVRDGESQGEKIVVIGQGEEDPRWLDALRMSGWTGPVGILNHTDNDAEAQLRANLDGLRRLVERHPAADRPGSSGR